jgi:hypothetical protein
MHSFCMQNQVIWGASSAATDPERSTTPHTATSKAVVPVTRHFSPATKCLLSRVYIPVACIINSFFLMFSLVLMLMLMLISTANACA